MFRIPGIVSLIQKQKNGRRLTSDDVITIGEQIWRNRENPSLLKCIHSADVLNDVGYDEEEEDDDDDDSYLYSYQERRTPSASLDPLLSSSVNWKEEKELRKQHRQQQITNRHMHPDIMNMSESEDDTIENGGDDNNLNDEQIFDVESQTYLIKKHYSPKPNPNSLSGNNAVAVGNAEPGFWSSLADAIFNDGVHATAQETVVDKKQVSASAVNPNASAPPASYESDVPTLRVQYNRPNRKHRSRFHLNVNNQHHEHKPHEQQPMHKQQTFNFDQRQQPYSSDQDNGYNSERINVAVRY